jgi:hypothetical protein
MVPGDSGESVFVEAVKSLLSGAKGLRVLLKQQSSCGSKAARLLVRSISGSIGRLDIG